MKNGNVIKLNLLHLNSCHFNGTEKVQKGSAGGGSIVIPPPPVEPEPTPTYTLSASVANGMVSATRNGSAVNLPYTANEGDVIVVEVTPNDGYAFEGWADGNTDNPRSITMNADVALSAQCVEVVQPPVGNYIQFEDAEVERVLMSKGVSSDGVGITKEDAAAVTSIGTWFKGNTGITSFNELVYFINVKVIGEQAFRGCSQLTSISLENVIAIEAYAFSESGLSGIISAPNLSGNLKTGAFYKTNVEEVAELGTITQIQNYTTATGGVFGYCERLKKVTLPSTLVRIVDYTFYRCSALATVIVRATTPPSLGANVFNNTNNCPIYVPDASLEAYKTATNWKQFADRIHPLSEIEDYYVSDALLLHLDGINKGNVEGEWQDLISGNTFVNHGAVAEADGWRFNGASSYMNSTNMASYGPGYGNRTFEIVAEFERENITEIAYMGARTGYAFGRYAGGKSILLGTVGLPSLADDMTSGVRIVSVSTTTALQIVASKINGNNAQVGINNHFDGGLDKIYLGKRASGTHFKGKIHAIRIHDRILSEEEILYNQRIDNKRFNLGLDI